MSLHIYTQEEFDALPMVSGRKHCPTGDYSRIKKFGNRCSFGEVCRFEGGIITPACREKPYFAADRIGSENRKAYFFNDKDKGIHVRAGCFFGTRSEFLEKLHGDNDELKTKQYEAALALAELVLEGGDA